MIDIFNLVTRNICSQSQGNMSENSFLSLESLIYRVVDMKGSVENHFICKLALSIYVMLFNTPAAHKNKT